MIVIRTSDSCQPRSSALQFPVSGSCSQLWLLSSSDAHPTLKVTPGQQPSSSWRGRGRDSPAAPKAFSSRAAAWWQAAPCRPRPRSAPSPPPRPPRRPSSPPAPCSERAAAGTWCPRTRLQSQETCVMSRVTCQVTRTTATSSTSARSTPPRCRVAT